MTPGTETAARQQTAGRGAEVQQAAPGVRYLRTLIVNVYFVGNPDAADAPWVLVDAGLPFSVGRIRKEARAHFGRRRPEAILLTHAHFDHVGALAELAEHWNVPVYVHPLERPYVTGQADYPPPDPTVGGGAMARLACLYPRRGLHLGGRVRSLPTDGMVPGMPGWRWIHTPGHTPGHVSFFRDEDRVLLAGDAFITVQQESALAVLRQKREIHGPPAYFTTDWETAHESVRHLADLQPEVVATGHGLPMRGEGMKQALETLANDFDRLAVPAHGRYVARGAGMPKEANQASVVSARTCSWVSPAAAALVGAAGTYFWMRALNSSSQR